MRILIVEDDRKLARQLQRGLDEQGHSVTVASDGVKLETNNGLAIVSVSDTFHVRVPLDQ